MTNLLVKTGLNQKFKLITKLVMISLINHIQIREELHILEGYHHLKEMYQLYIPSTNYTIYRLHQILYHLALFITENLRNHKLVQEKLIALK
jgi:hypothetical protein